MTIGPTLTTQRLILRPPAAEDFNGFVELMASEQSRFIGGPQAPAMVWRGVTAITGAWVIEGFSMFSVIERSSGQWIGRVGPWRPLGWPGDEVGWGLLASAQGKGYATEAAAAAINWAFDHLGWDDVIHCIAPDNPASQAVARRLGSANRGPGRMPPPMDQIEIDIWGQSRNEWRNRS
jgi:RimJ/RimL family protein N-acetyltransferase